MLPLAGVGKQEDRISRQFPYPPPASPPLWVQHRVLSCAPPPVLSATAPVPPDVSALRLNLVCTCWSHHTVQHSLLQRVDTSATLRMPGSKRDSGDSVDLCAGDCPEPGPGEPRQRVPPTARRQRAALSLSPGSLFPLVLCPTHFNKWSRMQCNLKQLSHPRPGRNTVGSFLLGPCFFHQVGLKCESSQM